MVGGIGCAGFRLNLADTVAFTGNMGIAKPRLGGCDGDQNGLTGECAGRTVFHHADDGEHLPADQQRLAYRIGRSIQVLDGG